jgi:4-amino-4-deoxy-L-arabinose transferase-like glycosyltransferase
VAPAVTGIHQEKYASVSIPLALTSKQIYTRSLEIHLPNHPDWLRVAKWSLGCWLVLALWHLGYPALLDPDEAHYAQLTREMLKAGSWLVPLLDGRPYIDKPVLFHWMQALAVKIVGETELAMRLPSALAAIGLFWTTRWAGNRLFDERTGDRGALMFATVPLTFVLASVGLFDMVFTAFLFGAVACLIVSATDARRRVQYVGYGLLTLAVMTKGPVALLLVAGFFVAGLACGNRCRAALLSLHWKTGFCLVTIASLPWFVWMWARFEGQFIQQYFLAGNLWYVTQPTSFSSRTFNHTLYVSTFLAGFFPWSIILIGGAVDALRRWGPTSSNPDGRDREFAPAETLLWIWIAVVFLFFSLARFKVDRYVYPAAPACCLLAARAWLSLGANRANHWARSTSGTRWAILALGLCLIGLGVAAALSLFELGLDLPPTAVVIPIGLLAGGTALIVVMVEKRSVSPSLFAGLLAMMIVMYGSAVLIGFPVLERVRPTARIARSLTAQLREGDRVALYRVERWRSSLRYYLMRPVTHLETPSDVQGFLSQPGRGYVVMVKDDYEQLRQHGINLHTVSARPAVTGTTGRGLRRQRWGALVVATADTHRD